MALPESIASYLDWWRNSIDLGNSMEADSNHRNVVAHVQNILGMIETTPKIDQALGFAVRESQAYFMRQRDIAERPSNSTALDALNKLEDALTGAKPSGMAKALGLG